MCYTKGLTVGVNSPPQIDIIFLEFFICIPSAHVPSKYVLR